MRSPWIVAIGIVALTQPAFGQNQFEHQVRAQLDRVSQNLAKTHQVHTGELQQNQEEDVGVELDRGRAYVIVAVCDSDCKDVDLRLLDNRRREIDRDVERDDYPAVAVEPERTDRYPVRAIMAACSAAPCRYGFGVFAR